MADKLTKRTRNALNARLRAMIDKYGYEAFRLVALKYIREYNLKASLEIDIAEKEAELKALKKGAAPSKSGKVRKRKVRRMRW